MDVESFVSCLPSSSCWQQTPSSLRFVYLLLESLARNPNLLSKALFPPYTVADCATSKQLGCCGLVVFKRRAIEYYKTRKNDNCDCRKNKNKKGFLLFEARWLMKSRISDFSNVRVLWSSGQDDTLWWMVDTPSHLPCKPRSDSGQRHSFCLFRIFLFL